MTPRLAFGAVVVYKNGKNFEFLILRQHDTGINWSFPKGKAEEGEDSRTAALREIREETGIREITFLDYPLIREEYPITHDDIDYTKINQYFIGVVDKKDVNIQEAEIAEYKWATYDEAIATFSTSFKNNSRIQTLKQAKTYLDEYERSKS